MPRESRIRDLCVVCRSWHREDYRISLSGPHQLHKVGKRPVHVAAVPQARISSSMSHPPLQYSTYLINNCVGGSAYLNSNRRPELRAASSVEDHGKSSVVFVR